MLPTILRITFKSYVSHAVGISQDARGKNKRQKCPVMFPVEVQGTYGRLRRSSRRETENKQRLE